MPSQNEEIQRPARQRANTSTFFTPWVRRGRTENASTPAPPTVSPPLQYDALIEALTPPASDCQASPRMFRGQEFRERHVAPLNLSSPRPLTSVLRSGCSVSTTSTCAFELDVSRCLLRGEARPHDELQRRPRHLRSFSDRYIRFCERLWGRFL